MSIKLDELLTKPLSETVRQQLERLKAGATTAGKRTDNVATKTTAVSVVPLQRVGPQSVTCPFAPVAKPRMTRCDKWAKRPCVLRYREFADRVRKRFEGVSLEGVHSLSWTAYFPMPESWSKKRKVAVRGQAHYSKPDRDNVDKAILDALFKQDSGISHGTLTKLWDDGKGPRIEISIA